VTLIMYYLAQERYIKPQITINGSRQLLNSAVFAETKPSSPLPPRNSPDGI